MSLRSWWKKRKAKKENDQLKNSYYTLSNNIFGGGGSRQSIFSPNAIDIDGMGELIKKQRELVEKYKEEESIIESLSDETKHILKLANEINNSGDFKTVVKLDKYVKEVLFNSKFNSFINTEEKEENE